MKLSLSLVVLGVAAAGIPTYYGCYYEAKGRGLPKLFDSNGKRQTTESNAHLTRICMLQLPNTASQLVRGFQPTMDATTMGTPGTLLNS